jgi:hypothetical protein
MSIVKEDKKIPETIRDITDEDEDVEYWVEVDTMGYVISESFFLKITLPLSILVGAVSFLLISFLSNLSIGFVSGVLSSILFAISPFLYGFYRSLNGESYYVITDCRFIELRKFGSNEIYNNSKISDAEETTVKSSFIDGLFGYGNVIIETTDSMNNLVFSEVKEFEDLRDLIEQEIQQDERKDDDVPDYDL